MVRHSLDSHKEFVSGLVRIIPHKEFEHSRRTLRPQYDSKLRFPVPVRSGAKNVNGLRAAPFFQS